MWLAEVGKERIDETLDPEQTIDRALETYLKKGYSKEWINQRLQSIQVRKELTDVWENHGIKKGVEYTVLTNPPSFAIMLVNVVRKRSSPVFLSERGRKV